MSVGDLIKYGFPGVRYEPLQHSFTVNVDGACLSHVGVDERTVKVGDEFVRVAAIGWVVTHESVQHRSFATQLLTLAADVGRENGSQFAALFTGVPGLYLPLGYEFKQNLCEAEPGGMVLSLDGSEWPEGPVDLRGKAW